MFSSIKTWKLASALKTRGNAPEAYSAVKELSQMGGPKAVSLLIATLERRDGVARSAARELGRLGGAEAAEALARQLTCPDLLKSVLEALTTMGGSAVPVLVKVLKEPSIELRCAVARALGKIKDHGATEALIEALSHDDSYAMRVEAANALGEIQDKRAIWVLVAVLKMRDESSREQQQALEVLQESARVALHKLGDPLGAAEAGAKGGTLEEQVATMEEALKGKSELHPKMLGNLKLLSEHDLIEVLQDLISAGEEISWAKLESRDPLLLPYFDNYEKRREVAESVGQELRRRGGRALLETILNRDLNNYPAICNWWNGMGE